MQPKDDLRTESISTLNNSKSGDAGASHSHDQLDINGYSDDEVSNGDANESNSNSKESIPGDVISDNDAVSPAGQLDDSSILEEVVSSEDVEGPADLANEEEAVLFTNRDRELLAMFQTRYAKTQPTANTIDASCNTDVTFQTRLSRDLDKIIQLYKRKDLKELHAILGMMIHAELEWPRSPGNGLL